MDRRLRAAIWYSERAPKSVCRCGHTGDGGNSEHGGLIAKGHGKCLAKECRCEKFTWGGSTEEFKRFMAQVESSRGLTEEFYEHLFGVQARGADRPEGAQ